MDLSNIHVGFVAKNYKHMCEVLREEVKESTAKRYQLKRWECYFSFSKKGQKIIVDKIYSKPKPITKRGGSNNNIEYIGQIKELIIQLLLYSGEKKVNLSRDKLLQALNMITEKYRLEKRDIDQLSETSKIDKVEIYEFYNSSDGLLKRNVESALDQLKNNRAIFWSKVQMVHINGVTREATEEECQIILKCQSRILDQMGYAGLIEVFKDAKIDEFNKESDILMRQISKINYVYEAYSIHLNRDRLITVSKLSEDQIKEIGTRLNDSVKGRAIHNSKNRQNKAIAKYEEWYGIDPNDKKAFRLNENYMDNQIKLINSLISID